MSKNIQKNILIGKSTLKEVLNTLNTSSYGIVFIVDDLKNKKLSGIFTDNDIRKALLKGANLSDVASDFMNIKFTYGKIENTKEQNLALLSEHKRYLPILDSEQRIVDFIAWGDIKWLPIMTPCLAGNEMKYITDCIATNWISSQGEYIQKFEESFAQYHKVKYATTCSNGTTALHLALMAVGIKMGDEVIVPNFTFGATANTVIHCGAKPVFVDIDENNWTIDPDLIEEKITERTKAIIPVHIYGHPCDMDKIMQIAKKYNLFVIEDCAESLGAEYKSKLTGTIGDVGCYSFFANKVITTGEGGMVITNNSQHAEKIKILRDHGMDPQKRYWHLYPGYNYRMTNLQAAIGVAQMERIEDFINRKIEIAKRYNYNLNGVKGISTPKEAEWAKNIYWLYTILIDYKLINRKKIAEKLKGVGIDTRPVFYPLHVQPPFLPNNNKFCVTEKISNQGLSLPSGYDLDNQMIDNICDKVKLLINGTQNSK